MVSPLQCMTQKYLNIYECRMTNSTTRYFLIEKTAEQIELRCSKESHFAGTMEAEPVYFLDFRIKSEGKGHLWHFWKP